MRRERKGVGAPYGKYSWLIALDETGQARKLKVGKASLA